MKKIIICFFLALFVSDIYSQSPNNFTYQSVVRDASGKLMSNKEISFRIAILKSSQNGSSVYSEEHSVTTNTNGLATMVIGKGLSADEMDTIDWSDGPYYLKVEVDPEGGFNFIAEDTTQLLSVPYALYSNSSGSTLTITGQDYLTINNNQITVNKVDLTDDVEGILPVEKGGTGSSTAPMVGVITAADAASARNVLELSTVASSGSYNDLTDKLTAGTNIDITNGVISSTDTNTEYTAGTGIAIDGNNSISSTITQYTDANAQSAFTAGTNIDITNGVISSTDTNTEYTAGTGISIDGNNAISTTVTDTDTVRSVTAGGNTLANTETLAFTAGSNVTITENAGAVTISSTDTNTEYTAGTGIAIDGNNSISSTITQYTDANAQAAFTAGEGIDINNGVISGEDATASNKGISSFSSDNFSVSSGAVTIKDSGIVNDELAGSIADSKLNQISTAGKVALSSLEIDGGTDIGAAIVDTDLIIIDDGANGTNRKSAVSRLKTYFQSATSLNDLTDVLVEDESYYFGNEPTNTSSAEKNIGIGLTALDAITTGDYNIAIGSDALTNNTTGNNNTAIGRFAMEENTSGYQNTALGILALEKSTSSGNNVAVGHSSLNSITDGEKNVGISSGVAPSLTTGDKNVVIGYVADVSANNAQNQIVIGHEATGLGDNYAVIGDSNIERLYAAEDAGATVYAAGLNLGGTAVSSTAAELNLLDGGTSIGSSITVANADGIIINDGGTMKTIPASDFISYLQSATSINDLTDALVEDNSLYIGNDPSSSTANAQYNLALGTTALDAVTTGDRNTAIGYDALTSNNTGNENTALGSLALNANTTGIENTALASRALLSNTSGVSNTASGYYALQSNTTGGANTASGAYTLYSNTTGAYNTAIGSRALQENIAATENTAVGYYALRLNTSGDYNTASGSRVLYSNTTGDNNTALGYRAGNVITTGSNNTIIGYDADPSANNSSNQIVIGKGATGQADNSVTLGNADVTAIYMAQDSGATVYAAGLNLSGGTTVSGVKFGTVTMSTNASQAFTVSGVTSSSIVTASFKSGDNGRYIKTVVPSTDTITITLDGAADNGVIMYIIIN